jgi:hypothetical protein
VRNSGNAEKRNPTYAFTYCIWRALVDAVVQRSAGSGGDSSSWVFVSHTAHPIQMRAVLDVLTCWNGTATSSDSNACMRARACTKAIGWLTAAVCESCRSNCIDEPARSARGHFAQISLKKSR